MSTDVIRSGFGLKEAVKSQLQADYRSQLIERIRANHHRLIAGDLTIRLAKEFGFCYGVERAVDYAYETRRKFPDQRIFLTNELIHNPRVNGRLREMKIGFLDGNEEGDLKTDQLNKDDVVIIAAFGTLVGKLEELKSRGCVLVDATCGSVIQVWKRVEQYAKSGFTAVVHGNYQHEETRATTSIAAQHPKGKYLVIWDKKEAEQVCRAIIEGCDSKLFMEYFEKRSSAYFDPKTDLQRIGLANQTTMLASESMDIAEMLRQAMTVRYKEDQLAQHFMSFDTICSATQDRQDAIMELVKEKLDLMIVIGGFNSSNTSHLCEIASEYTKAFHIDDATCILSPDEICHKPVGGKAPVTSCDWLPKGKISVGVTAGASTPNRVIGDTIDRILQCRNMSSKDIQLK